jgi:uncharacterized damage-inducible protein DinB
MLPIVLNHLQYNAWANNKLIEFIAQLDRSLLEQEVKSSFPTLCKTIQHTANAEQIWLSRLQQQTIATWPGDISKENAMQKWQSSSAEFVAHFKRKAADYYQQPITYTSMKGDQFTTSAGNIALHVVNHSTFHRGQMITILRALHQENLPATDYILYTRL